MDLGLSDQRALAIFINKHFDPLRIAESIEEHRFFESEPLIAVARGDVYVVIEGNRRLTALMGLSDSRLREEFAIENHRWAALEGGGVPQMIPVLLVSQPKDVAALLGYRHISGIEPWDPYAQARFIAQLVNRDGNSLDEVADLVGRKRTEIASKYRDYEVLRQADEMGLDTRRVRDAFGVFNNAMGRPAIRKHIGAPDPRDVDTEFWPLADDAEGSLAELFTLIFGDRRGEGRVIADSRQLGDLAKVFADESGRALAVLRETLDLVEALESTQDIDQQFARMINRSLRQATRAVRLEPSAVDDATLVAISDLQGVAQILAELYPQGGER
ncbi:hypothetical protein [Janibacter sp. Soil728]|uniref:hypothetical protein n=1 Tax=Janibacter sp. Soil728 TaxID=1736393 RepID=UPI0012E7A704|nr:hypothetical protein [Janibacter sp. Soil728]